MTRSATVRRASRDVQERAAAARREAERRLRRRLLLTLFGSVGAVVAVVVGLVVAAMVSGGSNPAPATTTSAGQQAARLVAAVPPSVLDAVGKGEVAALPVAAAGQPPLRDGGLPQVLYVGAEFCPYCAAERWALVQALSRFGTFSGLKASHSSPTDRFPNTATFSFSGSTFASDLVAFKGLELQTVTGAPLDTPTPAEDALWHHFTGTPGSFPFVDIGGHWVSVRPSYDPTVLQGKTMEQIAGALGDPTSPVAKAVLGSANALTAAICTQTGGRPSAVCSAPAVQEFAGAIGG